MRQIINRHILIEHGGLLFYLIKAPQVGNLTV
jgi:hypothetical protein